MPRAGVMPHPGPIAGLICTGPQRSLAPKNLGEEDMTLDRAVLAFAGVMTLLSVALTYWVHPAWAWFTVFIGLNLLQSAYTGACPAAWAFRKLGFKPGEAF